MQMWTGKRRVLLNCQVDHTMCVWISVILKTSGAFPGSYFIFYKCSYTEPFNGSIVV